MNQNTNTNMDLAQALAHARMGLPEALAHAETILGLIHEGMNPEDAPAMEHVLRVLAHVRANLPRDTNEGLRIPNRRTRQIPAL